MADYYTQDEPQAQVSGSWWDTQPPYVPGSATSGASLGTTPDPLAGLAPGQIPGYGQAPAAYTPANPNAPTYNAPALAATEKFVAPTADEAMQAPGTQFALSQARQGSEASAAAKGSVLSGGFQKELGGYLENVASGLYGNTFGQKLAGNQANNQTTLAGNQQQLGAAQNQYSNAFNSWAGQNQLGLTAYGTNLNASHQAANDYYQALLDQQKLGQQAGTQAVSV